MCSCPKTLTWTALKWMRLRGRWSISKGMSIKVLHHKTIKHVWKRVRFWALVMCDDPAAPQNVHISVSSGFAWILLVRPVSGFLSTGQTSVWRKLLLLHTEGVSEWLSDTIRTAIPTHVCHPNPLPPPNTRLLRTSFLLCPNHTHTALLCSCRCAVPPQTHLDWSTCRSKNKENEMRQKEFQNATLHQINFTCVLVCFESELDVSLDWKSHGLKLFSYTGLPVVKRCLLCLEGFPPKKRHNGNKKESNVMN